MFHGALWYNRAMKTIRVGEWKKGALDLSCAYPGCYLKARRKPSGNYLALCPTHETYYYSGREPMRFVRTEHFTGQGIHLYKHEEGIESAMLLEEKYDELQKYIRSKAFAWRADASRMDDIVQSTMVRLFEENVKKEFEDARTLWGRATNIAKEEIAQTFADRLPVSGVKFQAHWTATKALQAAGGDPRAAYHAQTGTSRVGRELIFAVAHGPSLYSPEYLQDLDAEEREDTSSLTSQDEDNVRVAISELSEQEQKVVHLRMWLRLTNAQTAAELGLSTDRVRKIWQGAVRKLRPTLSVSLEHRGLNDES